MSINRKHTNFHNDQTYHTYQFYAKTNLVDVRELLREAGEVAEAETKEAEAKEAEAKEAEAREAAEKEVDEKEVDEEEVDEEEVDDEAEEANAKAEAEAERAEIVADLTFEHFVDSLKYWFESECWSLIDDYSFSPDEWELGDVDDASDIHTCLLLPLAAAASQEIYWGVVAETLLNDFGKGDEASKA